MFHKFLERAGGTSEDKVDKKFLDKILLELDKLNKEKKILVQTVENSESDLKKRIEQLSGLVKKCRVLESKCSSLEKQNEDYKSNINALTGKLQSLSVENNRLNGLIEEQKNVIDSYVPVKSVDSYLKSVDSKNTDSKNTDLKNTIVKKQVDLKDNIVKSDLIKSVLTNSDSESSDSDDSDEKSVSSKKSSSSQSTVKLEKLPRNFKNKLGISPGLDFFD
jgi:DNA repair exonuclease SbcCD ATPase subunit